jgi:fructose-1-phosphate kinase PfkB-like protein
MTSAPASHAVAAIDIPTELTEAAGEYAAHREQLAAAIKRHQVAPKMLWPNAAELGDAVEKATAQTADAQDRVADLVLTLGVSGVLDSFQTFAAPPPLGRG